MAKKRAALSRRTLSSIIKHVLSDAELGEAQIESSAAQFVTAGTHAVRIPTSSPQEVAETITYLREQLARARNRLAEVTGPGHPVVYGDDWHHLVTAARDNRELLLSNRGVVGYAVGYRERENRTVMEKCIIVFVENKYSRSELRRRKQEALPRRISDATGGEIPIDIIPVGSFRPHSEQGGDALRGSDSLNPGTIGAFARDKATGDIVALTAMHVTGLSEFSASSTSDVVVFQSPPNGEPLGTLLRGTRTGIDAAAIRVNANRQPVFEVRSIGPVNRSRSVAHPADKDIPVKMFGAVTGRHVGILKFPDADLSGFGFDSAILVADIRSEIGDSGAALVDNDGNLLGILAGELNDPEHPERTGLRVFSPINAVLDRLSCKLP